MKNTTYNIKPSRERETLKPVFFTLNFYTMTLIFRQHHLDNFSVFSFQSLKNGKFITEYVAECDGWHSGKYEVEYTETYFQALRMLAKLKNSL